MSEKRILLGNEAIARGAYEAGVKVSAAYPGTPSTEVSESLVQYDEIYAEWAPNEKVATEVAIGASIAGVRSMCVMKHVGINVAADPLYTAAYTGVRGGLVLVVADDPGMYSSQNEQDSRMVARAAMVPIVEPSDSAEAKEFMKYAYDLSEKYDTPVILRSTTRLSHSQGLVELEERAEPFDIPYERDMAKYVMMPGNAIKRHVVVEARMKQMAEDANCFPINRVEYNDLSVGFITNGIAYQYVKEAMPQASVLKLGLLNPLPRKLIEEFASKVDKLYIFEELEPVVEEQVKSWGIKKAVGKEIFTVQGEYSANLIRERVLGQASQVDKAAQVPARPPILCPGCPHRSVYAVLNKLKIHAAGDIGCYTLGAVAPLSVIDTTICMGASISTLHGMEKAKGREYIKNWVAVIGDSTFMHTGINSLMNMVYNQAAGTVVILDNSTTGMTGHQDHAATGKTLKGQVVPAINIYGLCKSLGIEHVCEVDAFDQTELERVIKEEVARDAVSVIITKAPCALLKGIKFPNKCRPLPDKCKKCRACLRPGCPALTKNEDGTISIDETMCNGCGLCKQLCKFDAINLVKAGE
ncbi:indolepyruvate ferredoxin oxidoreductase subunit alpha [Enterocloster clostridioformis]|uniref:indolepyruvate ferredoxin oxidoreductase subunit alpha n=1 Tax=Enterocloster clostridioformis TaxID=1531 RepID=UPI00080C482E|nr:indolepyruvate ferredoxin oxidoreductase subunit alpha [Enterocloster clostridioformis]ANU46174.1 indolepyruvate ferredoxin oxidoreductase subunit alpha [Lachnoclostridium sp. YL32]NDO29954.1 indolepyruvate ferredoxin oxidoreductase subunit alpha [Enterocloster clostridioformis]OXE67331.1 indolepyruvate ferredoxin oxidoreductase subunit alpha [Enterocloster clostridioformis]QQQ99082.1 indolepyruvate ferredoxin oxidoreductase subunit alpha [Enterocloster clostridioformis]